jgi:hypothetical protein
LVQWPPGRHLDSTHDFSTPDPDCTSKS